MEKNQVLNSDGLVHENFDLSKMEPKIFDDYDIAGSINPAQREGII